MTIHEEKAVKFFKEGYNCSQAIVLAFCDVTGLDAETSLKISSSFGGGMGRMREVCGAVSGMFMVAGMLYGYTDPESASDKNGHYARIQKLASEIKALYGSYICRDILKPINPDTAPVSTERTEEFYKLRPCERIVADAARLMDKYIEENPQTA